jgi:hypothetical protein
LQCFFVSWGHQLKNNEELENINPSIFDDPENENDTERTRSRTLSRKQLAREHRKMKSKGELLQVIDSWHPTSREDCHKMARPCLYVSCRHHLYLDVNPETGSVKFNFPGKEVWELEESCALDVAERGGVTLEEAGKIMNLTRERIRQIEIQGLKKIEDTDEGEDDLESFTHWDLSDPSRDLD